MSGLSFEDQFKSVLSNAKDNLLNEMHRATVQNGNVLLAYVTKGIRDQKYASGYKNLAEATKNRKLKKGLDPRFLMEGDKSKSEDLWKSFEVIELNSSDVAVGSNAKYARVQEFGYEARGLEARAYFQPAMEDAYDDMKENWQNAVKETFSK
jgi:hypothetical protein